MRKTLRPYQQEALDSLKAKLKQTNYPLLVTASVGAGKSLIIAELLLWLESFGYRALCLTLNSSLIQQNAEAYKLQNGHAGIYCAGLKSKSYKDVIIFGSPNSVSQDIRRKKEIAYQPFNLIVVDECHNIAQHDSNSMYMRIFNHYGMMAQEAQYSFRVIGLTGTPFRGKGHSIVGPDQFFKEEVCNISASYLISQGFLVKPRFWGIDVGYDFSKVKVKSNGKFNESEIAQIVDCNSRLTGTIMKELVVAMETNGYVGIFIFATSRKHCLECMSYLPAHESAIITGETPQDERKVILDAARAGAIKYLISVNCLMTGVDVPNFDCVAWLRPTESLVMYIQGIGRGLRLSPGKEYCTIFDYAGNLDRHGDLDDPIINEALRPSHDHDPEYCISCYRCLSYNKVTARRCIGQVNNNRCDYYFVFRDCHVCGIPNDQVARECRQCKSELIDPNAKLKRIDPIIETPVYQQTLTIRPDFSGNPQYFTISYHTMHGEIIESYALTSSKALNIFYGNFVRKHVPTPSRYYMNLDDINVLNAIKELAIAPVTLQLISADGRFRIKRKIFE